MRSRVKTSVLRGAGMVGTAARISHRSGLVIFLFHNVSDVPSDFEERLGLATPRETFARQLDWICRRYEVLHPDELDSHSLPRRSALLTFDDGFRGAFEEALPLLEKLGVPAVLFLNLGVASGEKNAAAVSTFLEERRPSLINVGHGSRTRAMHTATPDLVTRAVGGLSSEERKAFDQFAGKYATIDDIEAWDGHPLFRYANHLWNHYFGPALSHRALCEQYMRNDAELRRFRAFVPWFAFTNGRYDRRTLQVVRDLRPRHAFTGLPLRNRGASSLLHRVELNATHSSHLLLTGALTVGPVLGMVRKRSGV